jgi:hypothetical protein
MDASNATDRRVGQARERGSGRDDDERETARKKMFF